MKQLILIAMISLSLNSFGQKPRKDTAVKQPVDTVYVFNLKDIRVIRNVLMDSRLQYPNGQSYTGKDLQDLLFWIEKHLAYFTKAKN